MSVVTVRPDSGEGLLLLLDYTAQQKCTHRNYFYTSSSSAAEFVEKASCSNSISRPQEEKKDWCGDGAELQTAIIS